MKFKIIADTKVAGKFVKAGEVVEFDEKNKEHDVHIRELRGVPHVAVLIVETTKE